MLNPRLWILLGCVWAALGVIAGAFGAHALKETFAANGHGADWETAVHYQLVQAFALVAFGLFGERSRGRDYPALLFVVGSFFFSGSIYVLCFDRMKGFMGPITPLGGLLIIVGWIGFAHEAIRRR